MTTSGFTLTVTDAGDEAWQSQVRSDDIPVYRGSYYKLTFTKEADVTNTESDSVPETLLQQNHVPYIIYGGYNAIDLNEDVSEIYFAVEGTSGLTKLLFDTFAEGTYTFSNIELVRITEDEYNAWQASLNAPITLELNTPAAGHFEDGDNYDIFVFTAEEAGTYVFTSDSSSDIDGILYSDAERTQEIDGDTDSGENWQFVITVDLDEGQTVYLWPYENVFQSADYTVTVTLQGENIEDGSETDIDLSCLPEGTEIAETLFVDPSEPNDSVNANITASEAYFLIDATAFEDEATDRYYELQLDLAGTGYVTEFLGNNGEMIDESSNQYPSYVAMFNEYSTYMFIKVTKSDDTAIGDITITYFDQGGATPMME